MASLLGHSNVAMTLNTYAEVDPDAKHAALGKIQDAFDIDTKRAIEAAPPTSQNTDRTPEELHRMIAALQKELAQAEMKAGSVGRL